MEQWGWEATHICRRCGERHGSPPADIRKLRWQPGRICYWCGEQTMCVDYSHYNYPTMPERLGR